MSDEAVTATATETAATAGATAAAAPNVLADASAAPAGESVAKAAEATAAKVDAGGKADGAQAASDGKAADGKADEADKPVAYEFKMPDGVEVDAAALDAFKAVAGEAKMPAEHAQKLVDLYAEKVRAIGEAQVQAWTSQQEKWVTEAKADKEVGGDRFATSVSLAAKAIERFGTPELRAALSVTGAGNHPEFVRVFARIGKAISEDSFVSAGGASATSGKSAAEVLYPSA